jgi:hypothetical protein
MRIQGTCRNCDRTFLADQAVTGGGRCPWCGIPFEPDYAAVLVEVLRGAEAAGSTLENALEKLADLEPRFWVDRGSVLDRLREILDRLDRAGRG